MSETSKRFWRPQIMRHSLADGAEEFAIHEVHFKGNGEPEGWTADALSDRYKTIKELKLALTKFLESGGDSIVCGDKRYSYFLEDVSLWIKHLDDQVLEYKD